MNSPIKTTIEARIAHVVGIVLGVGIALAGFVASHKGAAIPCTGLTVGGVIATVSHWRFFRVVEATVSSAVAWERENKDLVNRLYSMAKSALNVLLPANLDTRLTNVEGHLSDIVNLAQPSTVDEEAVANRVLAKLAAVATAPAKAEPAAATTEAAPAPSQTEAAVPASPFQNPPVAAEPAPSV